MTLLKQIKISSLQPHPDNRMITGVDNERVARIVKYISDDGNRFSPEYPLTVRPLSDGAYQIISGHHRFVAAKELGIDELPCVVREFSDVEALIRMVTSNDQRDNNPLDIGGAAKAACEKYARGMSYSDFAEKIGYDNSSLTKLVSASEVLEYIGFGNENDGNISKIDISTLKSKAQVIDTDFKSRIGTYEVKLNYKDDKHLIIEDYTNINENLGRVSKGWFYKTQSDLVVFISKKTRVIVILPFTEAFKNHYESIKNNYKLIRNQISTKGSSKWQSAFRRIPLEALTGYYSMYKRIA